MRKKIIPLLALLITFLAFKTFSVAADKAPAYTLKFKINGLHDTVCYFGHHFGDKQYIIDTAKVDSKGAMTFTGKKKLDGGIYLLILPSKKFFEVLIDTKEDNFLIETDTADFIGKMKIKGSPENEYFNTYQQFLNSKGKEVEVLRKTYEKYKTANKDSSKVYQDKMSAMDKEVKAYKLNLLKDRSATFLAKVIKSTQPPEVPEAPILANGRKDSTFAYRYYKAHFWDNIDFSDARLLRTPILHGKIKEYMEQLTYQLPDSVNSSCDNVIKKAKVNKEMFKYFVVHLTSKYERSNIMGMDAVFVHLAKNYYTYDQANWVDSTTIYKIQDRAKRTEPLLIGKKAPLFAAKDTSGKLVNLYTIKGKYTVLIFWDPDCGHCQKSMPHFIEAYDKLKPHNIEFVGACTEVEKTKWVKFIRDKKLKYINLADPDLQSNFRYDYYIESTPQIYVLDENKKIIAKKLSSDQLIDFFAKSLKAVPENLKSDLPKLDEKDKAKDKEKLIH